MESTNAADQHYQMQSIWRDEQVMADSMPPLSMMPSSVANMVGHQHQQQLPDSPNSFMNHGGDMFMQLQMQGGPVLQHTVSATNSMGAAENQFQTANFGASMMGGAFGGGVPNQQHQSLFGGALSAQQQGGQYGNMMAAGNMNCLKRGNGFPSFAAPEDMSMEPTAKRFRFCSN